MNNKFCISGYYGFDNFGDEVILKVLIENLKKFKCQPEITVFSVNPEKTSKLYNVKSVHSFKYFEVINSLFRTDYLISGGGSLLQDSTSIKSIIYYLGVIFLAYLFNKKVLIFAQGIGSIHNKIIAKITASLLKKAQYITVRDENSLKLLQQWGIKASLCNDPAWNIEVEVCDNSISDIGIQLRPWASLSDSVLFELEQVVNKY
ncbi:MAG: polysaccharide pyruvyl transferase family protein, partial [Candidatus Gastranaerophilales bacterium]|nr:polysaccharide pyruvyl transferase family protein [Candidatus Gastranaerophilales bacterium]